MRRQLGVVSAVVVGLGLRVVWLVAVLAEPQPPGDDYRYFRFAQNLASGDGYVLGDGEPSAFWPPGYPLVLTPIFWLVDHTPIPGGAVWAGAVVNLACAAIVIVIVARIADVLGGPRAAALAAWLLALWPNHIYFTSSLLAEGVFNVLVLGVVLLLLRVDGIDRPPSRVATAAVGGVVGLATLVRPVGLLILGAVALVWWARSRDVAAVARASLILGGSALLVIAPWTIRNAVTLDSFVPIGTQMGTALCIGNNPDANGAFAFAEGCEFAVEGDGTTDEVGADRRNREAAIDWILDNPASQLRLVPQRLWHTFRHDADGLLAAGRDVEFTHAEGRALRALANGYYAVMGVVMVGGLWFWRRNGLFMLLVATAAALTIAVLPFFAVVRYHQPILVMMAAPAGVVLDRVAGWVRRVHAAEGGAGAGGERVTTARWRSVLVAGQITIVVAALVVLLVAYARARPTVSLTTVTSSFETSEPQPIGEPWVAVGGAWTAVDGAAQVSPEDATRPAFLLAESSAPTRLDVTLAPVGPNAGLVFRFVDAENYWTLLYRRAFGAWSLVRVVNGEPEVIDRTPSVSDPSAEETSISVTYDEDRIEIAAGRTTLLILDPTHGAGSQAGLVLESGGAPDTRWEAVTVAEIPPAELGSVVVPG